MAVLLHPYIRQGDHKKISLILFVILILLLILHFILLSRTKSIPEYYESSSKRGAITLNPNNFLPYRLAFEGIIEGSANQGINQNQIHGPSVDRAMREAIGRYTAFSASVFIEQKSVVEKGIAGLSLMLVAGIPSVDNFFSAVSAAQICFLQRFADILPQPYQTLAIGMVLGTDGYLAEALNHSIKTMGIQHIFTVSGANFNMLANMVLYPLRRVPSRRQLFVLVPVCLVYSLLVGVQYPVLRACSMFLYYCVGKQTLAVQVRSLHGLLLWVVATALIAPGSWSSISFQLTTAATLGIMCLYRPFLSRTARLLEGRHWLMSLLDPGILGLSVFVLIAPVLATHFPAVSFASVLYTAALFWIIELCSFAAFVLLGYICFSLFVVWAPLRDFLDQLAGGVGTFALLPLVTVLSQGSWLPSLTVQTSLVLRIILWTAALVCLLHQWSTWYFAAKPRLLQRYMLEEALSA